VKVMKFGGTSVADQPAIERLIALVRAERQDLPAICAVVMRFAIDF